LIPRQLCCEVVHFVRLRIFTRIEKVFFHALQCIVFIAAVLQLLAALCGFVLLVVGKFRYHKSNKKSHKYKWHADNGNGIFAGGSFLQIHNSKFGKVLSKVRIFRS